jgi:hypothetical protein
MTEAQVEKSDEIKREIDYCNFFWMESRALQLVFSELTNQKTINKVQSRRFFASALREQLFELKNEDVIKKI